ncbi:hypothetical protein DPMN_191814 [Dreissena polymorpha]|uniref:Uncharacterized protein n=1 Tax=Dreissena polymorpha TaxID=45954 RepID=A0A9D3Y060_DREPO|nr:hypothetical protein DPMN_191814 [Dreissena polymorpha]
MLKQWLMPFQLANQEEQKGLTDAQAHSCKADEGHDGIPIVHHAHFHLRCAKELIMK